MLHAAVGQRIGRSTRLRLRRGTRAGVVPPWAGQMTQLPLRAALQPDGAASGGSGDTEVGGGQKDGLAPTVQMVGGSTRAGHARPGEGDRRNAPSTAKRHPWGRQATNRHPNRTAAATTTGVPSQQSWPTTVAAASHKEATSIEARLEGWDKSAATADTRVYKTADGARAEAKVHCRPPPRTQAASLIVSPHIALVVIHSTSVVASSPQTPRPVRSSAQPSPVVPSRSRGDHH